jgi:hypothetical protein
VKTIKIKGTKYQVVEKLAVHGSGLVAVFVLMPDGTEKVAVRDFGIWRFWEPEDRIKPLVEFLKSTPCVDVQGSKEVEEEKL